jgi:hypothetical protein
VKESLPIGALTLPLQTDVQLITVGAPALPPFGVTVIDAEPVAVEM